MSATGRPGLTSAERQRKDRKESFEAALLEAATAGTRDAGAALRQSSLWRDAVRRYTNNRAAVIAGIAFLIMVGFVIFAPIFDHADPYAINYNLEFQGPSWAHPFGADMFGRDLFVRTALGGRLSIEIGICATFAIMFIGILYGSISGFIGGRLDNALMRFLDTLYGLPYLPFAILTLAVFGTVNFWTMVVALTIASWFTTARVMRGQIITLKENDYVRAARAVGARWHRILFRHLLPNTLGLIIVFVFLELPGVVLGEAFLSFIGLGINPPKASWGSLAEDGYTAYATHPYIIIVPSVAIAWLIISAFFIADGLRDALDPRTRETRDEGGGIAAQETAVVQSIGGGSQGTIGASETSG